MSTLGRLGLQFTGRVTCNACGCRLRPVRRGLRAPALSLLGWLLLAVGAYASVKLLMASPFVAAVGAMVFLELRAPLELDRRDEQSVRIAERRADRDGAA